MSMEVSSSVWMEFLPKQSKKLKVSSRVIPLKSGAEFKIAANLKEHDLLDI